MAHGQALVRRLDAVETLGAMTFICTDKTGTLTCNEMSIVECWTPAAEVAVPDVAGYDPSRPLPPDDVADVGAMVGIARRCSDGHVEQRQDGRWHALGDPMEAAIDVLARRCAAPVPPAATRRFPFDPRRRRMSVLHDDVLSVKGAPDTVLPRCRVTPTVAAAASDAVERYAALGWRTLAIARRHLEAATADASGDDIEHDLELLGVMAFEDPPRPAAHAAITACRRAGIRVAMVTGDHPATALAIAREVGLSLDDRPPLVGADLPDDDEVLGALVDRDGVVIARVSPEHKLRIAAALRRRGHVVAMTGDGVNDGPALHEADIGVAMGRSGTDVAREAADLVLLDDDFATIVRAVEQGRSTFANIRRFLTYHLTDNVAELTPFVIWALSGGRFPLAIGVLQVLALDIGTDMLPALALGAEPPRPGLLDRPPSTGHLIDRTVIRRAFARLGPTEAAMAMLAFTASLATAGWRPGQSIPPDDVVWAASGAAFSAVVLGQLATALACRSSTRWIGAVGVTGNRMLASAIGVEVALLVGFLTFPPLARVLEHQPPTTVGLLVAIATMPAIALVDLLDKHRHPGPT